MMFSFELPTPLQYFAALVASDDGFPLLEACTALALDDDPDLDIQQVMAYVDQLQARVKRRLPTDAGPMQRLRVLNQFFFNELGFGGNINDYHNPDNSFLHVVLRTRRGIPISLAVLWLELAQGLGVQARGVNFPGHFMVKVNVPQGQVVIDPFTGQSLSREDLSERLEPYKRRQGLIGDDDIPVGLYLQSAAPREILARVLRNLKEIYIAQEDGPRLIGVLDRLVILLPEAWEERRDRGLAWAEMGQPAKAVPDLEAYLQHSDGPLDADAVAEHLSNLRRALS